MHLKCMTIANDRVFLSILNVKIDEFTGLITNSVSFYTIFSSLVILLK